LTEPVSQTAEAQKILFWTDKRPIAPDVETKITCTIAEIGMTGVQVVGSLMLIGFLLLIRAGESEDFSVAQSMSGPFLIMLAVVLGLLTGTRAQEWFPRSTFQSGIPTDRTRLSRILFVIAITALAGFTVSLLLIGLDLGEQSDLYLAELAGLHTVCALASYGSSIIVRARWILELRAEQGHGLAHGNDGDESTASQPALQERPIK
jgi:hypothetical protein